MGKKCEECNINNISCECLECGKLLCEFCFNNYHGVNCGN